MTREEIAELKAVRGGLLAELDAEPDPAKAHKLWALARRLELAIVRGGRKR